MLWSIIVILFALRLPGLIGHVRGGLIHLLLVLAVIVQFIWIAVGTITHWDPYPFAFLLTCSNILQLILIFVIAVAQRQQNLHDQIRADADYDAISRLLYHQQVQDDLLLGLAQRAGIDVADAQETVKTLTTPATA